MANDRGQRHLLFEWQIEILTGEEGAELRLEQARAIRDLLLWVKRHRQKGPDPDGSYGAGPPAG